MLRSIVYFHMLSYPMVLGGVAALAPELKGMESIACSPMSACPTCKGG